ncbi:AAA family ATPase [uncultured Maribacter sp.]|uniref:ATP-dependent nuclease n=1 Tax=uncultured Maribacter sp. TaxID=431308 RepID=UPI0026214FB3|nr:AAA family ATPase [uncultured Maribacter sp.]
MYLDTLKLWNFRKYSTSDGAKTISKSNQGLSVEFNDSLNVLIGENDSGKTAIIDSIKYILRTKSLDTFWLEDRDFYDEGKGVRREELRIECIFKDFTPEEAGSFIEWIGYDAKKKIELKIWLTAVRKNQAIYTTVKAGHDDEGKQLDGEARENLKAIYLKPLRDALAELTPGYRSRLAQILKGHSIFKDKKDSDGNRIEHKLEEKVKIANAQVSGYFDINKNENDVNFEGKKITKEIKEYLDAFSFDNVINNPEFFMSKGELSEILKNLSLVIESNKSGLGSLNKLYMAAEFLLLNQANDRGLKLALIEEIEAHIHPQAQLQVIEALQNKKTYDGQLILTTHSTTLTSKVKLEHLILCRDNNVFPLGKGKTMLEEGDYNFLERFLDDTKANLFFARGLIFVEGDSENLLIPAIAEIIDRPLYKFGVSIVNVGSIAFLRYSKIFERKDGKILNLPVSIVTDLDVPSIEYYNDDDVTMKLVFYLDDSNIKDFEDLSSDVLFNEMKGIYTSINNFFQAINTNKVIKRFPNGVKRKIEETIRNFTKEIDKVDIDELKNKTHNAKTKKYTTQNIQGNISSNWTLEYDIALSEIREVLHISILEANMLQQDNKLSLDQIDEIEIQKQSEDYFETNKLKSREQVAYDIFKPLNDKEVSKAIVAQRLSYNLLKGDYKDKILNSPELAYLREAIYHVTKSA